MSFRLNGAVIRSIYNPSRMQSDFTIRTLLVMVVLLCSVVLVGQNYSRDEHRNQPWPAVEILSDTRGVDFTPYLKDALEDVRLRWLPVIPKVARAPRSKQGTVIIQFAIMKDGQVSNLRVDRGSGNRQMDRAAFNSIRASSPFPPLPPEFDGQVLAVRLRFYYNPAAVLRPARTN